MVTGATVYLDASAIAKYFLHEPELASLAERVGMSTSRVTSIISMVEVPRAVARRAEAITPSDIRRKVGRMAVIGLDRSLASAAAAMGPPALRSLDAIHLASAMELGPELEAFLTYDRRLAVAARDLGLRVESPGVDIWSEP